MEHTVYPRERNQRGKESMTDQTDGGHAAQRAKEMLGQSHN